MTILRFYFICCISNILWLCITSSRCADYHTTEQFGIIMIIIFVCFFYAPLCSFIAYMYKLTRINKHVLSYPFLFSSPPFITAYILKENHNQYDRYFIGVFIIENAFIMVYYIYNHFAKKRRK